MKKARFPIINDDIHRYYLSVSQKALGHFNNDLYIPKTLKTDAWNEMEGALPEGGIVPKLWGNVKIIEFNKLVCDSAKSRFPLLDITQGDIRELPFKDGEFDLILDLSTLDHIPQDDLQKTIRGYNRVLKKGGEFLLITWFLDKDGEMKQEKNEEWKSTNQYLFDPDFTVKLINKYFAVIEEETIYADRNRYLHYMLMKKTI